MTKMRSVSSCLPFLCSALILGCLTSGLDFFWEFGSAIVRPAAGFIPAVGPHRRDKPGGLLVSLWWHGRESMTISIPIVDRLS
jgi:hypothetical protein